MLFPKYFVPLTSGHMVALYFLVLLWEPCNQIWPVTCELK